MKKLTNKKNFILPLIGLFSGLISGFLGAGGGLIVVPSLIKLGVKQNEAHSISVCTMFPICIVGSIMYINSRAVSLYQALPYIPMGIVGAIIGSIILSKINQNILRKIFGCFSIWAAYRLLVR